MKNKKINFLLFIAILILVSACKTTSAPTQPVISTLELPQPQQEQDNLPQTEAEVPRVTVEDAKAALDSGEAIIVDVRSAEAYAEGHVTDAISVPLGEFENNIANVPLDKNQWIITYCT